MHDLLAVGITLDEPDRGAGRRWIAEGLRAPAGTDGVRSREDARRQYGMQSKETMAPPVSRGLQARHVYLMAALCLMGGLAIGYAIRLWSALKRVR